VALTIDQVASLAPDASALAAGKKTADPRMWAGLGQNGEALWGECTGSALYQTRVSLADFAAKCSCPSRKFPCKHALGLLFLSAQDPGRVPTATAPEWVTEWLTKRTETATKKKERAEKPAAPPDAEAQARRAEKRAERVRAGAEGLELWMSDLMRTGLGSATARGDRAWHEQAARLVDAQAPGLASRVRLLAAVPRSIPDFHLRLCDGLGRLALLTHAVRRLDALTPALAVDVRTAIGWTLERDEVVASGERVVDEWAVVGQVVDEDDRIRTQRTWLRGRVSGRGALVLQFAAGPAHFAEALPPGTVFDGELAFWPGACPVRALVNRRDGEVRTLTEPLPGLHDVDGLLDAYAAALARQPWIDRHPAGLGEVSPAVTNAESGTFVVVDRVGRALPLVGSSLWKLFAIAGGGEIDLFGEWDGRALTPLGAIAEGRFHQIGTGSFEE
jgi:hypothetical protein